MAAYVIALAFQLPPAECALIRSNHRYRRWKGRKPHGGSSNPNPLSPPLSRLGSPSMQQLSPPFSVLKKWLGAKSRAKSRGQGEDRGKTSRAPPLLIVGSLFSYRRRSSSAQREEGNRMTVCPHP